MKRLRFAAAALALGIAANAHSQIAEPPAWLGELALSEAQQNQVFQIYYQLTRGRELFAAEAQALAEVADIRLHAMRSVYELLTAEQRTQALHLPIRYE